MPDVREPMLRADLLALATTPSDPAAADRLWGILDDYEAWPGHRLVGADGAEAAWLIAQLGDLGLQRRALEHLEHAVDAGDAPAAHFACLDDRVRMATGRPQVYGSQLVTGEDGTVRPWPIEDPDGVDERRSRVGLPPLAEHTASLIAELHRRT
jgi:Family of unknown function (DUF6624)